MFLNIVLPNGNPPEKLVILSFLSGMMAIPRTNTGARTRPNETASMTSRVQIMS